MKISAATLDQLKSKAILKAEPPASALSRWKPEIHAAKDEGDSIINIYDSIGENWDGTGVTVRLISSVLRKNDKKDVTVNINSPGGDFFEGVAIYNALKSHNADVNINIIGLAASAASIIAMAGDSVKIAESGFLMIHNAWTIALGDKHDMQEVSDMLAKFDESMHGIYSRATGLSEKEIIKMMDAETWIGGKEALEKGFVHALLDSDDLIVDEETKSLYNTALKKIDLALAKQGITRSERRNLIKEISGTPSATENTMPSAGKSTVSNAFNALLDSLTGLEKGLAV